MEHKRTIREIILTNVDIAIYRDLEELKTVSFWCLNTHDCVIDNGYSSKQALLAAVEFSDEFDRQVTDLVQPGDEDSCGWGNDISSPSIVNPEGRITGSEYRSNCLDSCQLVAQ